MVNLYGNETKWKSLKKKMDRTSTLDVLVTIEG